MEQSIVKISNRRTGAAFLLKADNIVEQWKRSPKVSPIPANEGGNNWAITIDLGQVLRKITINGIVDELTTEQSNGIPYATKWDLEGVIPKWSTYKGHNIQIDIYSGSNDGPFYGAIERVDLTLEAGKEDRWPFSIVLSIAVGQGETY